MAKPSKLLIALTLAPIVPLALSWVLTEGFSASPSLGPLLSRALPLVLLLVAVFLARIAYTVARDEEPEWGPVWPFKLIEGIAISYAAVAVLFLALVVLTYFLRA